MSHSDLTDMNMSLLLQEAKHSLIGKGVRVKFVIGRLLMVVVYARERGKRVDVGADAGVNVCGVWCVLE